MRSLVGLIGMCLMVTSMFGFCLSLAAGIYAGVFMAGAGLFLDALRK